MRTLSLITLSVLSLALPWSTFANPHAKPNIHSHRDLAHRARGEVQLHKRFENTRFTYYAVGLGACGKYNNPGDFIVALNSAQYGGGYPGPHCFQSITISYGGKSTGAVIMDECPGCPYGGLDMSEGLFKFFAPLSKGVIYGSWVFNDGSGGGGGGGHDDPPPPPPPAVHHTHAHTTTTTKKPDPTTTTHAHAPKATTTSSKTTTTTSHTTTTSAEPEKTPDNAAINNLNQAVMGLGGMVDMGRHL